MKASETGFGKFKKFFNSLNEEEQRDVWDFITALRSDDLQNDELKEKYTAPLRSFLFNKSRKNIEKGYHMYAKYGSLIDFKSPLIKKIPIDKINENISSHYIKHYRDAFLVLENYYKLLKKDINKGRK
jgi:uncharacterized protein YaaN involved in tellurite resistance